ncbi:META domain-containing protein [Luteimonas sp. R10]|uniref:META domain-containing protein n=1 Tax=Luteimonas sp. R10 TaxID=3108176 RepID=UPI00308EC21D|nr:META domain-containing protein [Luteimonas sp. R10]
MSPWKLLVLSAVMFISDPALASPGDPVSRSSADGFNDSIKSPGHQVFPFILRQFRWRMEMFDGGQVSSGSSAVWIVFDEASFEIRTPCNRISGAWGYDGPALKWGGATYPTTVEAIACEGTELENEAAIVEALREGLYLAAIVHNVKLIIGSNKDVLMQFNAFDRLRQ